MQWSGDQMIIATFDLIKNENFVGLMIEITLDLLFQSHEIRSPDPQSFKIIFCGITNFWNQICFSQTVQKQRNWVQQTWLAEATEYASEAVLVLISTEQTWWSLGM